MKIEINKDVVKSKGNEIVTYSEEFRNYVKQIYSIIDSINLVWEGSDSLKYINTMKEVYLKGLDSMSDAIQQYGTYLKNVPEVYEMIDEIYAKKNIDV